MHKRKVKKHAVNGMRCLLIGIVAYEAVSVIVSHVHEHVVSGAVASVVAVVRFFMDSAEIEG